MRKLSVISTFIAFGIFSVGHTSSLQAQSTVMFENFLPSMIETNLRNQTFWEPLRNNNNNKSINKSESNSSDFSFKPILAQRKINQANFVSKTKKFDPTGAEQIAQMFLLLILLVLSSRRFLLLVYEPTMLLMLMLYIG